MNAICLGKWMLLVRSQRTTDALERRQCAEVSTNNYSSKYGEKYKQRRSSIRANWLYVHLLHAATVYIELNCVNIGIWLTGYIRCKGNSSAIRKYMKIYSPYKSMAGLELAKWWWEAAGNGWRRELSIRRCKMTSFGEKQQKKVKIELLQHNSAEFLGTAYLPYAVE